MADYVTKRRYLVQGSAALQPQEEPEIVRKPSKKKKRKRKVLPRSAVSLLPVAYVGLVVLSCIFILTFSTLYIHKKTELASLNKNISILQTTLQEQRQENQELFNEITNSTALEVIEEKAIGMGMVPAEKIVRYSQSEPEYVKQKEDIPNE